MDKTMEQEIKEAQKEMEAAIDRLLKELQKLRTGKANPSMLQSINVEYYGNATPLNQVANVSTSDSKTIVIQPWEKSIIDDIEKAIFEANIGLTPQNDGDVIHINIPPLTEERRKELVKYAHKLGEDAKVSVRNARQKAMSAIKKAVKEGYPEDAGKREEANVEKVISAKNKKIDQVIEAKENDVMTV